MPGHSPAALHFSPAGLRSWPLHASGCNPTLAAVHATRMSRDSPSSHNLPFSSYETRTLKTLPVQQQANPHLYYPIARPWGNPQNNHYTNMTDYGGTPMARWEGEGLYDQAWNALGEIHIARGNGVYARGKGNAGNWANDSSSVCAVHGSVGRCPCPASNL